ncbi:MerR family transcriptional regulator [Gracilibacillus alcaliphilus]|uniref:MerR family transcriptional regulator n=1 Tax=Gracilibacillus alcaliphilus TaxID=1401441 RepID=UPI00195A996F|nr:MerR family transcriptional regulator [Gracilibacillus alcaliphilus]MBM7679247.1 DNA-binding transcriptional MerR regulator [Gracilibacillus alcaliphilus]
MELRPIDIAKKLDVGTSALRHYEKWGIVPKAIRKENGYRVYTEVHEAYFQCIRAMYPGFGMATVRRVMPLLQENKFTEALWEVNAVQAELFERKEQATDALHILSPDNMQQFMKKHPQRYYTIGEVEAELHVPATTLRHWEKEDLITPARNPENGYRMYTREDMRRLLIIRTVQSSVYLLETVRDILDKMNQHSLMDARQVVTDALTYMDYQIEQQLRGAHYLYRLIELLKSKRD